MPTAKRVQRKAGPEHTFSSFQVKNFDASARASINHQVANPKYSFEPLLPEDLVFSHTTSLTVRGEATYPPERAGVSYELTINGEDGRYKRVNLTLGDIQSQNKHGSPTYRQYRGRTIPVVDPVPGIALLDRNKQGTWTAWINVLPRLVSDMLVILNTNRSTWVSLHETKAGRTRWIRDISIQTTNPEGE